MKNEHSISRANKNGGRAGRMSLRARSRWLGAAVVQVLEPRVLMTGTYSAAFLSGTSELYGMTKTGSLEFNGTSQVTSGFWFNVDGSPQMNVQNGSTYTVSGSGQVNLSLTTEPLNSTVSSMTTASGVMNGTRDVVALNETSSGTPTADGLDVLVTAAGSYTASNLTGTWNIAAQDFRGSITVNSKEQITGGTIFLESNQKAANVESGGTVTINSDGSGTISFTTAESTGSGFHTVSLAFTMNAAKDVMAANSQALGNGTSSPAELAVLIKNSGTYNATTDVVGKTWMMNSALGVGSLTFAAGNLLSGNLTNTSGVLDGITGTYTLGNNGAVIVNLTVTPPSGPVIHESFAGVMNQHKNLMGLDRAISNGDLTSSLTVLTYSGDHAPTEAAKATWPISAYETSAIAFDYNTLVSQTVANVNDLDLDTLKLKITNVASGTLQIIHNATTNPVDVGVTEMEEGDTLLWTPPTSSGLTGAFSLQADDGTEPAANATKIFVNTGPLPVVSAIATKVNALEAKAGSSGGNGTIVLERAGGKTSSPLTVTIDVTGTAVNGTNYTLVGPNGTIGSSTSTVTFNGNESTITLDVAPIQDNVLDPTLSVIVTVEAPGGNSPLYALAAHPRAQVNVLDSNPTIVIVPAVTQIKDGGTKDLAFYVERTPAQGGTLANVDNTVTITYSGTANIYSGSENVANDLPATALTGGIIANATSVTFTSDQVKKIVYLSPGDDGVAATETITASVSGTTFTVASAQSHASVSVLDDAPTVHVTTLEATASEGNPKTVFGEFQVTRTGGTGRSLTVTLSTSGPAVQGTHYTLVLANDTTQTVSSSVTILSGSSSVLVDLVAIEDGLNDGNLKATVTAVVDGLPSYHVGSADKSVITILNNNRFPTIGSANAGGNTTRNTALELTYSDLATDTGAALATGSDGTLDFEVGKVLAGKLKIEAGGSGPFVAAGAKTVIHPGDVLEWIPPTGVPSGNTAVEQQAFTLFALDGNLESLSSTLFTVTVSA